MRVREVDLRILWFLQFWKNLSYWLFGDMQQWILCLVVVRYSEKKKEIKINLIILHKELASLITNEISFVCNFMHIL